MSYVVRLMLLLVVFCFTSKLLIAQKNDQAAEILKIKHTKDFTVTGDGSSNEWANAEWNTIIQRPAAALLQAGWHLKPEQVSAKGPNYQTLFKILYSDNGIYCFYKCEDSAITSTLKEDFSNLFDEDVVEAFFRPDTTVPAYFEYELSPLNYELPILILNNKANTSGWKAWKYEDGFKTAHATKVNGKSAASTRLTWTAEFFIPFRLLPLVKSQPPAKGTRWRANFYRIDYDLSPVYSSWQLTRSNFHDFERFGAIEFD